MVATPTRIGFVIEPYRRAVSETLTVSDRHGNLGRESADPIDTYFASTSVAQQRADERQDLLSRDRRMFSASITDVEAMLPLLDVGDEGDDGGLPTARFIDTERGIDMPAIITEVVIDTEAHAATVKFWG